jgi:UDP-N-acetylmuramyl tripeptide synthase
VDWGALHDVPVVLVTGTNGKTTTVRLLHAIGQAAGRVTGVTSTDWIRVGDELVEQGDCAGPDGARTLLRDPRVELAVCETARGGILRRGLVVPRADAAVITNVAEDHLGQWGVLDLAGMLEAKLVLARLVARGGRTGRAPLVLNADDEGLLAAGALHDGPVAWFTLQAGHPEVARHVAAGGTAALLDGELLLLRHGHERVPLLRAADLPVALGGAARHNLANALAAALAADAVGLPPEAIRAGLLAFRGEPRENPGRGNRYELGGVTALADFAHNVHAMTAQVELLSALPARRRLLVLGQAGDRSDDAIRALVRTAWRCRPERVIVKEQFKDLRGRRTGEVPAVIEEELVRLGAPPGCVSRAPSELDAVREALAWARAGDVLALFLHSQRDEGLELLDRLAASGWRPGRPLPG